MTAGTLLLGVAVAAGPVQADTSPQIAIDRDGQAYTVSARFVVPQAPAVVLDVLTDYAGIADFLPDITRSVVRSQEGDRTVVEQEAVSRVLLFSKTVHLRLAIHESADGLRFHDELGTSFRRYEGGWHVAATPGGGSAITYRLVAQPTFGVPGFLLRRVLSRDAGEMIDALRAEMAARGTGVGR